MDLGLLDYNVVLAVADVRDVTFAEVPSLDPDEIVIVTDRDNVADMAVDKRKNYNENTIRNVDKNADENDEGNNYRSADENVHENAHENANDNADKFPD